MNIPERRVQNLIAPNVAEFSGAANAAREPDGDWLADEGNSSLYAPDCFLIGCSDYPAAGEIALESSFAAFVYHDNIANLVAPTDFNCLSAMQFAVEVCRVKNIVVGGHYGCRGVRAATENHRHDILSHWLSPVVRLRDRYQFLLGHIAAADRLDALCELNVIEQVAAASRTTVVRDAWAAGRELTVSGLVGDRRNIPLADFQIRVGAGDSVREKCAAAIADFERRWKLRP